MTNPSNPEQGEGNSTREIVKATGEYIKSIMEKLPPKYLSNFKRPEVDTVLSAEIDLGPHPDFISLNFYSHKFNPDHPQFPDLESHGLHFTYRAFGEAPQNLIQYPQQKVLKLAQKLSTELEYNNDGSFKAVHNFPDLLPEEREVASQILGNSKTAEKVTRLDEFVETNFRETNATLQGLTDEWLEMRKVRNWLDLGIYTLEDLYILREREFPDFPQLARKLKALGFAI